MSQDAAEEEPENERGDAETSQDYALMRKIAHGEAQADAGELVSQAEARRRMARWLSKE
jgi:hypothetical protein